jgi:hypothetical protein
MKVYSSFAIAAFRRHVTILLLKNVRSSRKKKTLHFKRESDCVPRNMVAMVAERPSGSVDDYQEVGLYS